MALGPVKFPVMVSFAMDELMPSKNQMSDDVIKKLSFPKTLYFDRPVAVEMKQETLSIHLGEGGSSVVTHTNAVTVTRFTTDQQLSPVIEMLTTMFCTSDQGYNTVRNSVSTVDVSGFQSADQVDAAPSHQPTLKKLEGGKGYNHQLLDTKNYPPVETRVFWNSKYQEQRRHSRANYSNADVQKQSSGHSIHLKSANHSKSRCFISGCHVSTTHMKKHVIGRHLPKFVSSRSSLTLQDQMRSYERLLMSIAKDVGCLSIPGLLNFVLRRKWFPRTRCSISADDLSMMQNFQFWITGEESPVPTISPPNCVSSLIHWRVLSYLLDRVASRNQSDDSKKPHTAYNASIWRPTSTTCPTTGWSARKVVKSLGLDQESKPTVSRHQQGRPKSRFKRSGYHSE